MKCLFSLCKCLTIFLLLLPITNVFGQVLTARENLNDGESIMYFDSEFSMVNSRYNAEYYRVYKLGIDNKLDGPVTDYFKSGKVQNIIAGASFIDVSNDSNFFVSSHNLTFKNCRCTQKWYIVSPVTLKYSIGLNWLN